jgi:hypothetical protein
VAVILAHSPEFILSKILITLGVVNIHTSTTWPVIVNNELDTPDNMVSVWGTAGIDYGRIQNDGSRKERHGIQIRIRARNDVLCHSKASEISHALDRNTTRTAITLDNIDYCVDTVSRLGPPLRLGKEAPESQRYLRVVNALITLRMEL